MRVAVVLPTYNEADNIREIISRVQSAAKVDVIVVDDSSPDGTAEVVRQIAAQNSSVTLIVRPTKDGLASAYMEGFKRALELGYDRVIQMDSDFSHDPKHLADLIQATEEYDLAVGSKYIAGGQVVGLPPWRKALSLWGNRYARFLLKLRRPDYPVIDSTSGYACWRADTLRRLGLTKVNSAGYGYQIEMKWHAFLSGARIKEIPITFTDRVAGKSKLSRNIFVEALFLPIKLLLS